MKTVCWITPDCFVDADWSIVPLVLQKYKIHWIVEFEQKNNRYSEKDFDKLLKKYNNLTIVFLYFHVEHGYHSPLNILDELRIKKIIKRVKPDVIYSNMSINAIWKIPLIWSLPYKKTIFSAHQGKVHAGMDHHWLYEIIRRCTYKHVRYINMFSKSQAALMHEMYPKPKIFESPLPLKDFDEPTNQRPNDGIVRFTSFGRLVHVKRVDLLIKAACNIYEKGYKNIKIIIKGGCSDWKFYQDLIKYPEIFETDIRLIDNEEIPNIFNGTHYFVQSYSVVSQSGPMKIGFRYNVPLITSDLPGFTDEMVEGVTGFIFKSESVENLEETMIKAIKVVENDQYQDLLDKMKSHVDKIYSTEKVLEFYSSMFESIMSK